ncbi:unnamed protein product [Effrenium voratum]|uniref:Mitochondrial carrier protein n=1 Tax=Effrenium voratum TaxID=2562239 RepID=A0AA36MP86_9DINO|nr:unnamed protein product [Effrenium voratum]CAJ1380145.1 unnamed protein product [Effrenium voratum]CAJ1418987.1 unnamed protein product [Effrenium voratum]|mmetsp:Transcript_126404/g.300140  ORF Transcript_126404/g.300140 Transcript_126404/m.300140 type:complete len:323 (+) Transcript_126404:52-1020(+)
MASVVQVCREAAASAASSMEDPLVQQQAAEGAILRAQAAFVAYPLDVLKTQVQSGHHRYNRLRALPCLLKDYRLRIFRGYPGVGANSFLMGSLMFGGYRFFDNFWQLYQVPDYWRPAVAGASIGALCGFVATPLEQVKTIMALQETWLKEGRVKWRIYGSVLQGAVKAPWRLKFYAATPLMIRTALFDSQLFFYNSRLREWANSDACPANMHFLVSTVGFMMAGLVGATINYPFDRVKGHMMGQAYQVSVGQAPSETTYCAFRWVLRDGLAGLFRGLPTRSMLHATVWCVVGIGRELCETLGLRERAKRLSAAQGHSRELSA